MVNLITPMTGFPVGPANFLFSILLPQMLTTPATQAQINPQRRVEPPLQNQQSSVNWFQTLDMINKETGELNINLTSKVEGEKIIMDKKKKESNQKINNSAENTLIKEKKGNIVKKEYLDLLIFFASHLNATDYSIERIIDIIENNKDLSHTFYTFMMEKENFINNKVQENKINIIIKALVQDLLELKC